MRDINLLVVHCSATPPALDIGAKEIRKWHTDKGWSDIGYHYVIRRDGSIELGRDLDNDGNVDEEVGAHAYGFNRNSIGICLTGGTNEDGKPDANFTLDQYLALRLLHLRLSDKYPDAKVLGHRDLPGATKSCPCFNVREFLEC